MTGNKRSEESAVVYARYSSHNQQEQSIEGQLAAAKRYAESKGYTIVKEYCDRAKTGTNDNREEFQRMLSDCAKKQFSVIIVWKVDRFGRNREEITFNKYRAKKHGVRVEYVAENVGAGPESVILESVLEGMAEYYSLQLSQNVKRGQLEGAKKHHVIGGKPPLGYMTAPDKTYALDPKTAPYAKMIFEKYAAGMTEFELIRWLNEQGIRTPKGALFTKNSLAKLLRNERYTGVYIFKDLIRDEDGIPAIIDRDLFDRVQDMLKQNRRAPAHKWSYSDYILTDKLFCGHCGSAMVGISAHNKKGLKYCYYGCRNRNKDKSSCQKKPVSKDWIENAVLEQIGQILSDPDLLKYIADKTWELYESESKEQEQKNILIDQLSAAEKGISNLVRTLESGIQSDAVLNRLSDLESQKADIERALAEIELSSEFHLTRDHIQFFLEKMAAMDISDRDCQKQLIRTFVNAIFLYDDHVTITFNYSGDGGTVTLQTVEKAAESGFKDFDESVRMLRAKVRFGTHIRTLSLFWMPECFGMTLKIPER